MSLEPLSTVGDVVAGVSTFRDKTMDFLIIGTVMLVLYLWWRAHTADLPDALVPNQDVADVAPTIPDSVYTYNMPFFGGQRRMIATPKAPMATHIPRNPSLQPTFAPIDSAAENPDPGFIGGRFGPGNPDSQYGSKQHYGG